MHRPILDARVARTGRLDRIMNATHARPQDRSVKFTRTKQPAATAAAGATGRRTPATIMPKWLYRSSCFSHHTSWLSSNEIRIASVCALALSVALPIYEHGVLAIFGKWGSKASPRRQCPLTRAHWARDSRNFVGNDDKRAVSLNFLASRWLTDIHAPHSYVFDKWIEGGVTWDDKLFISLPSKLRETDMKGHAARQERAIRAD